jgi:hypothetical protein
LQNTGVIDLILVGLYHERKRRTSLIGQRNHT